MPRKFAWLTGNTTAAADFICRRLLIPNDLDLIFAVNGALLSLTEAWNWEQFGAATPEETAALMAEMYQVYWSSDACMIGAIMPYASTDPPPATLPCDGGVYNRVDYPKLYDALNASLIIDPDTFQTPDLRGQFVFGADATRNPLDVGGAETHTLTVDEMPEHTHTDAGHTHTDAGHTHTDAGHTHAVHDHLASLAFVPDSPPISTPNPLPGITAAGFANIQSAAANIQTGNADIEAAGGDQAHNNMPPFVALNYCIVAW